MRFQRSAAQSAVAAFLFLAFLWVLALTVSPQLHERIHADAAQAEHTCAVTLMASGSYEHVAPPPMVAAEPSVFNETILPLLEDVTFSICPGAALLEHAPPAQS